MSKAEEYLNSDEWKKIEDSHNDCMITSKTMNGSLLFAESYKNDCVNAISDEDIEKEALRQYPRAKDYYQWISAILWFKNKLLNK